MRSPAPRCPAVHCAGWRQRADVVWRVGQVDRIHTLEQEVVRSPWPGCGVAAANDGDAWVVVQLKTTTMNIRADLSEYEMAVPQARVLVSVPSCTAHVALSW